MSSTWGENIKISIFGESHGAGIGVVLDGLPAGEKIDSDEIMYQMYRRAPGRDKTSTPRRELDIPDIVSGILNGTTTGTPLCAVIKNGDIKSGDYDDLNRFPRPGHADYTGCVKYGGYNDYRGGGHFSGRLTAPMVFAGAVCRQVLERKGITVGAHIFSIGKVFDDGFDAANITSDFLKKLTLKKFPAINDRAGAEMKDEIEKARAVKDSVGGIVECASTGIPAGLGSPIFGGVENRLSSIIFGIPAVKGIEFGSGFKAASMHGSENNDAFCFKNGSVATATNNHGGILGGITSSMPILFRAAFKPTPSISKKQTTVDLKLKKEVETEIRGRHDPCVVVRAVPVVEALASVCILDLLLDNKK